MKLETKVVRAKIQPDPSTGSIVPPIYQTATYVLEKIGKDKGFDYTRSANPTRAVLEENLAAVEGGDHAVAFATGMSSVDSVMRLLNPGDHVVSSDDVYGGVSRLFDRIWSRYGIEFTYVDSTDPANVEAAIRPNTRMIWVETPTNPLLKVTELDAMSAIARSRQVLLAVDSTFATPVLLRPLEHGAHIVVHSTTKYISGHNQLVGGIVITNDQEIYSQLKFFQKSIGAVPSPFDCWLTLLGIKTLVLRIERQTANAMAIADFLEGHPKIAWVSYPGLESHPGHTVAKREMSGFGAMISFELHGGIEAGTSLMNNVKLCALAESLGAVETMITHPATMTHVEVPREQRMARGLTDGLVRLSVGIEHVDDILNDLKQGLDKT